MYRLQAVARKSFPRLIDSLFTAFIRRVLIEYSHKSNE